MRVAGVLLAAGLSRRFGAADKLAARFRGLPLGMHAARALAALPLAPLIAVVGDRWPGPPGFATVRNPLPETGQAGSLALGVRAARGAGADGVLILLADMPLVGAAHLGAVLSRLDGPAARVCSVAAGRRSPPAAFGADWFAALEALTGDHGARDLLRDATAVAASRRELADVDVAADLDRLDGG